MSTKSPTTLRDLFDNLDDQSERVAIEDRESLSKSVKNAVADIKWVATPATIMPKIAELLDVPLPGIFVEFWQKADEVSRALVESRQSPDRTIDVSLLDCSTEATLQPFIEIRLAAKGPVKKIEFTVSLPMTFKTVELRIKGGAIIRATGGVCEIEGTFSLEDVPFAKLKEPVRIPFGVAEWGQPDTVMR